MSIQKQVRLPLAVAFEVAMQGLRIRMGRSFVTLMGVVLGVAFFMSILTGQAVRKGVGRESDTRAELDKMLNFITAKVGPLSGKTVGVIQTGLLNEIEERFLATLADQEPESIRLAGGAKPAVGLIEPVEPAAAWREVTVVLLMGGGALPKLPQSDGTGAGQPVIGVTRPALADAVQGAKVVMLTQKPRPEEIAERELEAKAGRFRTVWIVVISLLVTVIGISNAMLMSVTERFREIGTMKCLGALSRFVRQVFFIEASLLGLVGSIVGAVFGAAFSVGVFSLSYGLRLVLAGLSPLNMLMYFVLAVVSGVVLSIVAAIYPASFASRMVPATALRSNI